MTEAAKTRVEIAHEECTRDPIFLLQARTVTCVRCPHGYDTDGHSWWVDRETHVGEDESDLIDDDWLLANDCAIEVWHTQGVFASREEATAWAEARSYRWKRWRVYCVPAEGELATMLRRED